MSLFTIIQTLKIFKLFTITSTTPPPQPWDSNTTPPPATKNPPESKSILMIDHLPKNYHPIIRILNLPNIINWKKNNLKAMKKVILVSVVKENNDKGSDGGG